MELRIGKNGKAMIVKIIKMTIVSQKICFSHLKIGRELQIYLSAYSKVFA